MTFFTKSIKNISFFIILFALCLIIVNTAYCLEKRVSFDFNNQLMSDVARQISDQLHYKVLMDDDLATVRVTGHFDNVTLDDFFSKRILRGKNIVILFDDANHIVKITDLGENNNLTVYDNTRLTPKNNNPDTLEVLPGLLHRDVVENKNPVDPMETEVVPGLLYRDVVEDKNPVDPMRLEVVPGLLRRDVVEYKKPAEDKNTAAVPSDDAER